MPSGPRQRLGLNYAASPHTHDTHGFRSTTSESISIPFLRIHATCDCLILCPFAVPALPLHLAELRVCHASMEWISDLSSKVKSRHGTLLIAAARLDPTLEH